MTWLVGGKPLRSVLLTRLRYLGDVAMTTVVAEALRDGDPGIRLGYLCEKAHGEILVDHPLIDSIHLLGVSRGGEDARSRVRQPQGGAAAGDACGTWAMIRELRRARYDGAVDMFFNPRSACLLRLSGIPVRIGGTLKWRRRLYTHTALRTRDNPLSAQFEAIAPGGLGEHLCRLSPLVHAETGQDFLAWACDRYAPGELRPRLAAEAGPGDSDYLVAAPCATWPTKEWPAAHWRSLLAALSAGPGPEVRILVAPGREKQWAELGAGLGEGLPSARVSVLPAMNLAAVRRQLAGARGLISVDGGVMHMGVAVGTPTLALFGPTDPAIWFPYERMGPYRVLATAPACHPCHLRQCDEFVCLPELAPERVLVAARELFAGGRERAADARLDGGGR